MKKHAVKIRLIYLHLSFILVDIETSYSNIITIITIMSTNIPS